MSTPQLLQDDVHRLTKLQQLARSGKIDRQSSYFNHLIDIYSGLGRPGSHRTFTDRERERIDLFLQAFTA